MQKLNVIFMIAVSSLQKGHIKFVQVNYGIEAQKVNETNNDIFFL